MKTDGIYSTALEIHILTAVIAKKTVHALRQRLNMVDAGTSGLQYKILRALDCREQTIA